MSEKDVLEQDTLEQEMIAHCNNYMFQFKYMDELKELDICFNNVVNKENITTLEIPFLNNKIIMFYDSENGAFCYYTKGDTIYKYLNVACRKYVIEHNCRHLYLDMNNDVVNSESSNNEEKNESIVTNLIKNSPFVNSPFVINNVVNNIFVKKNEKKLLVKNVNKFILVGSLDDYEKTLLNNKVNVKNISFSDYRLLSPH